ncbi:DUF6397 family protein [Streptomyces sp. NPDC004609]|uniref:DUF6397 family protein n=1 Tax=Streptomyces sp. NPDC004609 TaxID=3364704 RepID=UPI0036C1C193
MAGQGTRQGETPGERGAPDASEAPAKAAGRAPLTPGRAAHALDLKRGEFDLALQLGYIRTVPGASGGPPGVAHEEIDRLRRADYHPDALRERVRTVGTVEGAALVTISPARFTRLARTGHFPPIRFYLNRYRAVVWLYLAEELRGFALTRPDLLTGRAPQELRAMLEEGEDRRARNWRSRRLGSYLRMTEDPWARAAAIASLLDPATVADAVPDADERSHLRALRPEFVPARPQSPAAHDVVERLLLADHPDEILWHRVSLAQELHEARRARRAPGPAGRPAAVSAGVPARDRVPGPVGPDPVGADPVPGPVGPDPVPPLAGSEPVSGPARSLPGLRPAGRGTGIGTGKDPGADPTTCRRTPRIPPDVLTGANSGTFPGATWTAGPRTVSRCDRRTPSRRPWRGLGLLGRLRFRKTRPLV